MVNITYDMIIQILIPIICFISYHLIDKLTNYICSDPRRLVGFISFIIGCMIICLSGFVATI